MFTGWIEVKDENGQQISTIHLEDL